MICTARLFLRPFAAADAADLFTIRGDPAAMAHWDWPADPTPAATLDIAHAMLFEMAAATAFYWTGRTKADATFAGVFDLSELGEPLPDLGFMVPRCLWGLGYGREAAAALVAEAWRQKLPGLKARIHAANERSALLLEGLGFVETGGAVDVEVRPGFSVRCRYFRLEKSKEAVLY